MLDSRYFCDRPEVTVASWSCLEITESSVVVAVLEDDVVDVVVVDVVDVVDVVVDGGCDLLIFVELTGPGVVRAEPRVL